MAFDAFLKIDGIPGECQDDKHKDWIEILSFSWGASQPTSGASRSTAGAATGGRVDLQDLSVVKQTDKTSPKLFLHVCNGKHIPTILVHLNRATGNKQRYMEYKLEDNIVTSYRPGGAAQGGETVPMEEVSFNYGKITVTYTETDHKTGSVKGDVMANWSAVENKGS